MSTRRWLSLGVLAVWVLVFTLPTAVQADMAPPYQPPGSNLAPNGETTQVQMVSETVTIEVQPTLKTELTVRDNNVLDWAKVSAHFSMRNQGSDYEVMQQARFPLSNPEGWGDGYGDAPEIRGIKIFVDGKRVSTTRIETPSQSTMNIPPVAWAGFDVTFPPGQDVVVDVSYEVIATGYVPLADFTYLLETGADWKDAIGSADIILKLPYEATIENVLLDGATPGAQMVGNEVRWHFDNLEPTRDNNIHIGIVEPPVWQRVLDARQGMEGNSENGNAWGTLARAYKLATLTAKGFPRFDEGGKQLYQASADAYEKAIALSPQTARWHAGYAELLWRDVGYVADKGDLRLLRAVQELYSTLQLDPQNEQAQTLLKEISYSMPEVVQAEKDSFNFLVLTATFPPPPPTPSEVPVMTVTSLTRLPPPTTVTPVPPEPSATSSVTQPSGSTQTSTPVPAANKPALPFCPSAIVLPAMVIVGGFAGRKYLHSPNSRSKN